MFFMFDMMPFDNRRRRDLMNPFRELEALEKSFFKDMGLSEFRTDIRDNGSSYLLEAELPGFSKDEIHVDIDDRYLTISAEKNSETEEKDEKKNYVRRERSYGSFSRSFDLSGIKADEITGEYQNGVLCLTLPKKDGEKCGSRRLDIR